MAMALKTPECKDEEVWTNTLVHVCLDITSKISANKASQQKQGHNSELHRITKLEIAMNLPKIAKRSTTFEG